MPRRDHNDVRIARYTQPPGTCLQLQGAGLLTGYGKSNYRWAPAFFGPSVVVRGRGTFSWPGGREEVQIGSLFSLLPDMPVEYWEDPQDPWQYQWLGIHGSGVVDFAAGCGFTPEEPVWHAQDHRPVQEAMRDLWDCLDAGQPAHPYDVQMKLYSFARQSAKASGSVQRRHHEETLVERAKAVIESQLHTAINVTETAAILHVSRTTLFSAFRQELQQSPVQYLRGRRISRAQELLAAHGPIRLADVAHICGFNDPKYFLRTFKEITGQTPREWLAGSREPWSP